jgi:hypothetical protein
VGPRLCGGRVLSADLAPWARSLWRAGPVGGHDLGLRRLRPRPRPPPPAREPSLPGQARASRRGPCASTPPRPKPLRRVRARCLRRGIAPPWSDSALASQRSAGAYSQRNARLSVACFMARRGGSPMPLPRSASAAAATCKRQAPDARRRGEVAFLPRDTSAPVGSPMRRQPTVARYASGEHCRTDLPQELWPRRSRGSRTVPKRWRAARQRRGSGGWRRTRPQTEPAESEERDPPTGPARPRLRSSGMPKRLTRHPPPARSAPRAHERARRAPAARGPRSRRRPWPRARPASRASRRSCAARTCARRWPRRSIR